MNTKFFNNVLTATDICPPGFESVSEQMLTDIANRIVTGIKPEKILLFGSYAYGQPTPDSDIDLLVIMETDARPADRVVTVSRLLRPRPFPLDILVRTPNEIEKALSDGDIFIQDIFYQGRVLYEKRV